MQDIETIPIFCNDATGLGNFTRTTKQRCAVGPGKRAALVVRQGDDPKWLAKSFCRRHNVPAQLTSVVQTNIEQNLAMLDQKK